LTTISYLKNTREKLDKLIHSIDRVMAVHELNVHFQYSRDFVTKVNKSFAANAFVVIQNELMASELLGVCRMWDAFDADKFSLPTVVDLAARTEVQDELRAEIDSGICHHLKNEDENERLVRLSALQGRVKLIRTSEKYLRTVNHRDKQIAHLLEKTRNEKEQKIHATILPKYGDEKYLLDEAKQCITELFSLIVDGSLRLASNEESHHSSAKLFAESTRFLTTREYNSRTV
jgi:AbiU2